MRKVMVIALFVIASTIIMMLGFGDTEAKNGCNLEGAWYTYTGVSAGPAPFVVTMTTGNEGFMTCYFAGIAPELFGLCPGGSRLSPFYGPIKKTGPNSFVYNLIGFSLGANEEAICTFKASGWVELDPECDSGTFNSRLSVYSQGQDPYGDDPYYCGDYMEIPYFFVRMPIDPPCDLPNP